MPRRPCRLHFAHTSPVYVTVDGKGARIESSIKEANLMLDAFDRFAMKNAKPAHYDTLRQEIAQARHRLAGD